MKLSNILVLVIICMLASTTATLAQSVTESVPVADQITTLSTKVKGITCETDLVTISANIEKLDGVRACKTGKAGPTTKFEIAYNPAVTTEEEIYTAIQNTGGCENPNDRPYKVKK
jgi:copper chaperone CopZ